MANILAIDTSSSWCSVALSLEGQAPLLRHEAISAGASQLLLPWINSLLNEAHINLKDVDAIAVGIGPGAFTGVRLGVAAVQGLAISQDIQVAPVCSLDAIAAQLISTDLFKTIHSQKFMVAIDARMEEVYWAHYETEKGRLPKRIGDIHLTMPEDMDMNGVSFLAGSAFNAYSQRMPKFTGAIDADITISALGVLKQAEQTIADGLLSTVRELEPLYVRDKVAFTTAERERGMR